jgi:hypothetical protein
VCHTCDNPKCIKDKHYFEGAWKDNVQDEVRKGRHSCFRKGGVRFSGAHTAEAKIKISEAAKKMWSNPGKKAAIIVAAAKGRPENWKELKSAAAKKMWADKDFRARRLQAIRAQWKNPSFRLAHKVKMSSEEVRNKMAQSAKKVCKLRVRANGRFV